MARKPRPKKQTVVQLLKQSALLSDAELRSLISGLEAMECDRAQPVERDEHGKPVDLQGHIDEKWIGGCGPYRYLRWWEDGKHKSAYLGKADDE